MSKTENSSHQSKREASFVLNFRDVDVVSDSDVSSDGEFNSIPDIIPCSDSGDDSNTNINAEDDSNTNIDAESDDNTPNLDFLFNNTLKICDDEKKNLPITLPETMETKSSSKGLKGMKKNQVGKMNSVQQIPPNSMAMPEGDDVLSFFSSLCDNTYGMKEHTLAKMYKENYKNKKCELARFIFNLLNELVFDNKFPSDFQIIWTGRLRKSAGMTKNKRMPFSSRIYLSTVYISTAERLRDTIVHEICHAASYVISRKINEGHGKVWRSWSKKISTVIPEIPLALVRHTLSAEFKFTYLCLTCNSEIGVMTKRTNVKRCAKCRSVMLLLSQ